MKIWEPKPPGTLWATPGLLRDSYITIGLKAAHRCKILRFKIYGLKYKIRRVLLVKPTSFQLVKKFPAFTSARHVSLP